jgi:nuclear GTP-binding protein
MGKAKKEKNAGPSGRFRGAKAPETKLKKLKGENFYRDRETVQKLNMYKSGRPVRDKSGTIIKAAAFQSSTPVSAVARVQPDRRWFGECPSLWGGSVFSASFFVESLPLIISCLFAFSCFPVHFLRSFLSLLPSGNTRVIGQKALSDFRDEMAKAVNNPYQVLLRQNKLPMSLITDPTKVSKEQTWLHYFLLSLLSLPFFFLLFLNLKLFFDLEQTSRVHLLETESFGKTFGPKAQRKKPRIGAGSIEEMVSGVDTQHGEFCFCFYFGLSKVSLVSKFNSNRYFVLLPLLSYALFFLVNRNVRLDKRSLA